MSGGEARIGRSGRQLNPLGSLQRAGNISDARISN